ncbi:MAG TPA: A24 family peptidase [Planctomycetaceae bacterium]|nr:A24 family peptidase [Planctomycetaceae bacterium]
MWSARAILLLALLAVAAVTDVRRHRIYNGNTYPGILAGLAANWIERGREGLEDGLAGFAVCGAILLVCFVLFQIGGGDVKLIAMVGAFLGVQQGVEALLWTFVLGSIAGVAVLIWRVGFFRIVRKTAEHLRCIVRARSWVPLTNEERQPLRRTLFLAPAAFVAVCLVLGNAEYRWW